MSKIFDPNPSGVAQLINSPNQWAKDMWRDGCANHWMPQEVDMSKDGKQWKDGETLDDSEKLLIKRTLGLFAAGESLVNNSIASVERVYITDGACRQYMSRKDFEESLHNWTVETCCEAYGLDVKEVAEAYKNIPTIKAKDEFLMKSLDSFGKDFNINSNEGRQQFIKNMFVFYMICEGTWFFTNFALILSLGRQNKLPGLCDQIQYTLRDESLHVKFGETVINQAREEYPGIWTKKFQEELVDIMKEGVDIEVEYAKDILPNGVLGVNAEMLEHYVKFLANTRLKSVGLDFKYEEGASYPFTWLKEQQDSTGMTAFFERREKNYQQAGVMEDDF